MTEAKINEILAALEFNKGVYQREAVDAAIAHKEEITPYLLRSLEQVLANPSKYTDIPSYIGHIYAVTLLAHFKEHQAHQLIVDLFSLPKEIVEPLFGDHITEDLPILLFRTCKGSVDQIKMLVLNKAAYDFCRSAALRAMVFAVVDGLIPREEMVEFLASLFSGDEAPPDSYFWSGVANAAYDLYPEELMDIIGQAYEDELIWSFSIGKADFERVLAEGRESALAQVRERMQSDSLDDVQEHMSWWACFDQSQKARPPAVPAATPDRQLSFATKPQPHQKTKKPGRNDPCWCGSGKKYKHCHLKSDKQNT